MCISRLSCFMLLVISIGLTSGRAAGGNKGRFPRPSADAIAKAEQKVKEVYKDDLAKANEVSEKAALAGDLLTAADGVGKDDATRLVLLTMAKDLAVEAEASRLAVRAVTAIVSRFQPDGPTDPKEQIERGNASWKEVEKATADKRLGLQVQAAEWYLRAKPAATGFDKTMIEKRLAEIGGTDLSTPPDGVVAVWEHHSKNLKEKEKSTVTLFANGQCNWSDGRGTWEKSGSTLTLIFLWEGGKSVKICTLSNDGRSYDGRGKNDGQHVWGKLLSGEPMPAQ